MTESFRALYIPITSANALQLFTQPHLSLSEKLFIAGCSGGFFGAHSRDLAVSDGREECSGDFMILQIQIDQTKLDELKIAGAASTSRHEQYTKIEHIGVQRLVPADVSMSLAIELHRPKT